MSGTPTPQNRKEAAEDSVLIGRFYGHLLDISNDIIGETPAIGHWIRHYICRKVREDKAFGLAFAEILLARAISEAGTGAGTGLTLPIVLSGSVQTNPTDTEIANAVNGFMSAFEYIMEAALDVT